MAHVKVKAATQLGESVGKMPIREKQGAEEEERVSEEMSEYWVGAL